MSSNFVYAQKLAQDNNCIISFDEAKFVIQDKVTKNILHQGSNLNGLYHFLPLVTHISSSAAFAAQNTAPLTFVATSTPDSFVTNSLPTSSIIWHNRLGHHSSLKF